MIWFAAYVAVAFVVWGALIALAPSPRRTGDERLAFWAAFCWPFTVLLLAGNLLGERCK